MTGVAGFLIGVVAAGLGVYALVALTKLLAEAAPYKGSAPRGVLLILMLSALKLAFFALAWKGSQMLGGAAPRCFIAAVVMIYCGLVLWAIRRPLT